MRAGGANETAVLLAKANKRTLEASLLSMRKSRKETENAMCLLLAQTPGGIERGKLAEQSFPDSISIGIPVQMLGNRPDVQAAEMELTKAFYATPMWQGQRSTRPSICPERLAGLMTPEGWY